MKTRIVEYEDYNKKMYRAERRFLFFFWTPWFGNKTYASSHKGNVEKFILKEKTK